VNRINHSLDADDEGWKHDIPGKPLLASFASAARLDVGRLKTLYLQHATRQPVSPFAEIVAIFEDFSQR
jgi:hypothetical protein